MKQEDAKDILRNMKAEMEGVLPKDIQFNDLRKKKKNFKKVKKVVENKNNYGIMDNYEGFGVAGAETQFCSYKDISKKKRKTKEKSNLEEWGPFDFFRFAHKLYINKYKTDWNLNIGGSSLEVNRIKDKFIDIFGFCCNLIIRDYIVFFFESHIDDFVKSSNGFYFSQMRRDDIITIFKETYNFQERFIDYISKEKQKNKKYNVTKEEMEKSYIMGDMTLIGNYGIVLSLNWLLQVKRKPKREAIKIVVDACKDMYKKNMIDIIKKSTEIYSPYPSDFVFKSPQLVFNKINSSIYINVEFNNNDKFKFLQKGD